MYSIDVPSWNASVIRHLPSPPFVSVIVCGGLQKLQSCGWLPAIESVAFDGVVDGAVTTNVTSICRLSGTAFASLLAPDSLADSSTALTT